MQCDCPEWPEGIKKINAPILLQSARSGYQWQYDGVPFRFCPWCGAQLTALSPPVYRHCGGPKR